MTNSYPGAIDSFTNPTDTDTLDSATVTHAAQHDNINDAVLAIETALGASLGNVVLPARSISTTAPLTGGGDLSANRTLSLNIGSSLTTSASNLIVDSTVVPYLANANTFTASPQQITVNAAGNKGLIIKGAASQTADTFLNQNSSSTILSGFNAAGQLYAGTTASVVGSTTTAITSAAYTSATVAVFTYGGTSLVQAGQRVTVAGVTGGTYNGTWTVSAVTSTTFTVLGSGFTNVAGSGGTFTLSAVGSFVAGTAAITPLVVQGAVSQTANLQEWQNSSGTILARITSVGDLDFPSSSSAVIRNANNASMIWQPATGWRFTSYGASNIPLIAKGNASQTGDLQQWQNSAGTALTSILAAGTINFASGNTSATATAGAITAPALVTGYITMQIAGTTVKVPYYSN